MNKFIGKILTGLIAFTACFSLQAAPQSFTIDDKHSYVLWKLKHLGFSPQVGKWYVSGDLVLDKDRPQDSKVNVSIDMSKGISGIPELDQHMQGARFFDVAKYPKATFESNKVEVTGPTSAKVQGMLTIRGITKPVTLMVNLNKEGKNILNDKYAVGFSASTKVKGSDFGMTLEPGLSDEVEIEIGAEAFAKDAK